MKPDTLAAILITGLLCQFNPGLSNAQEAAATASAPKEAQRGPGPIIEQKIRAEVAARLADAGAAYDDLQVTVAVKRDRATPFKVSYRGLRNFKGRDGTAPEADGSFIMHYIGGGQWQGELAGTEFTATVGTKDKIDLPFVNDPKVLGEWKSVDFVKNISQFNPAQRAWKGELYLKGLTFLANGKTPQPWWTWTKGFLMHSGDQTASRYEIRQTNGASYLFLEWKSGDVTIAHMKPHYYVLAKGAP
jgi:bla regulator protein BlaR1